MFVDLKKRVDYSVLDDVNLKLKEAFSQIKDEFEDHLIAINENTNEIKSVYQYLAEMDSKIEKIGQRRDQLQMFLKQEADFKPEENPEFNIKPLTKKEQEIFHLLYTAEENSAMDYRHIARLTGLTEDLVSYYITSIIEKGIPLMKKCINNKIYLSLNKHFKELQTKQNIVGIEQTTFRNF